MQVANGNMRWRLYKTCLCDHVSAVSSREVCATNVSETYKTYVFDKKTCKWPTATCDGVCTKHVCTMMSLCVHKTT